ncbi:hypothetical protein HAX54_032021 [Datura stramonium]|uniref:Uncharacterized protein n=1 Tax=Datura stramonium TaxID=4076 RepID=A0ABS8VDA0_DATST|nr:hypothetical protein [Datura stramonium]
METTVKPDVVLEADDGDTPTLSSHALEALKEFLAEQSRALEEASSAAAEDEVSLVSEDWRLSQFWYNRETAETVADEVSISAGRLIHHGEDLPSSLKHSYPIIVADPPYLSQECLEKVTQTISFLMRPGQAYLLLLTGEVQTNRA